MSNFNVNDRVLVKQDADFVWPNVRQAFAAADFKGRVNAVEGDGLLCVTVEGGGQWNFFFAHELEPVVEVTHE